MDYEILKEKLLEIGDELAMVRGGSCYNYTMKRNEKFVVFSCKKHEEAFEITMSFREIESIWYIPGRILFKHAKEREMKANV